MIEHRRRVIRIRARMHLQPALREPRFRAAGNMGGEAEDGRARRFFRAVALEYGVADSSYGADQAGEAQSRHDDGRHSHREIWKFEWVSE